MSRGMRPAQVDGRGLGSRPCELKGTASEFVIPEDNRSLCPVPRQAVNTHTRRHTHISSHLWDFLRPSMCKTRSRLIICTLPTRDNETNQIRGKTTDPLSHRLQTRDRITDIKDESSLALV